MQKAGEKVDEATGNDKLIGKGPAEKIPVRAWAVVNTCVREFGTPS